MYPPEEEVDEDQLTMEQKQERLLRTTLRDVACKVTCVILTQPLQGVQRGLLLPLRAGQLGPGRRGQQVGQHQRG